MLISLTQVLNSQVDEPLESVTRGQRNARPKITSQGYCAAATGTKLYCLVTQTHVREQLSQGCYLAAEQSGVKSATSWVTSQHTNRYTTYSTKLYCLVTEAHGCEQLAQDCYATARWLGLNSRPLSHQSGALPTRLSSHLSHQDPRQSQIIHGTWHSCLLCPYIYNGCLAWYNVVLTPRVHSSVKFVGLPLATCVMVE